MRVAVLIMLAVACSLLHAEAQSPQRPSAVVDVALSRQGNLISRCEDEVGNPTADAVVSLLQQNQTIATTTCRDDGWFVLRQIPPGNYTLQVRDWSRAVRVWTDEAAPPGAREPIAIIVRSPQPSPAGAASAAVVPAAAEVLEEQAILPLKLQEGSRRSAAAAPGDVASPVAIESEAAAQNTHALHIVETLEADATFDPLASPASGIPTASPPTFVQSAAEPVPAPAAAATDEFGPSPVEMPDAVLAGPPPMGMPPCPEMRHIPSGVGPTVGDVVVTSLGVAGITMGITAIHKYDNRRIRRVVSP